MKSVIEKLRFILLVLLVLLAIIMLVLLSYIKFHEHYEECCDDTGNDVESHQFLRFNPSTSEQNLGIISSPVVKSENYFYEELVSGKQFLVSKFGKDEYICKGSCICENQRKSSLVLTRGLTFLVAAVSSIIAIDSARDYFGNRCLQEKFEETCERGSIQAEVEECQKVLPDSDNSEEEEEEKEEKKFLCNGNCLWNTVPMEDAWNYRWLNKIYSWKEIWRLNTHLIGHEKYCKKLKLSNTIVVGKDDFEAKEYFMRYPLDAFCRKNSEEEYPRKDGESIFKRTNCIGYHEVEFEIESLHLLHVNYFVNCRRTHL